MPAPLRLGKFSVGVGDRFGQQAKAQLQACLLAARKGTTVIPVWNKSNREHIIIGSEPSQTRTAADEAVRAVGWTKPYHVDADHIRSETVDRFIPHSDFFTIDVADSIGQSPDAAEIRRFIAKHPELVDQLEVPALRHPVRVSSADLEKIARKYLTAVREAARTYRSIAERKQGDDFITEISMDETDEPQSPCELLVILAALADEGVPVQTLAPKFSGRFNKGIDYIGDVAKFEQEFSDDLAVIAFAVKRYGLLPNLKISVHSGSDKFSLYPAIRRAIGRFDAGLHLKTAGTTWLEEVIGLAETGGEGLRVAKEIYAGGLQQFEELRAPYATVIDIDRSRLPPFSTVSGWTGDQFASALRHDPGNQSFNPHFRQLLHISYKVAATMGGHYLKVVNHCRDSISRNVTTNLLEKHIQPLFLS